MCLQSCMHNRLSVNGHSSVRLFQPAISSTVANSTEMHWITYEIVYTRHTLFSLIDHIGRWDSSALFYSVYNYGSSLQSTWCTVYIGCLKNISTLIIWLIVHRIDFSLKKKKETRYADIFQSNKTYILFCKCAFKKNEGGKELYKVAIYIKGKSRRMYMKVYVS